MLNNPTNFVDPLGLQGDCNPGGPCPEPHSRYTGPPQIRFGVFGNSWINPFYYAIFQLYWDERGDALIPSGILAIPLGDSRGSGGCGSGKEKINRVVNQALQQSKLGECLNKIFGPGNILTNQNLPYLDTRKSQEEITKLTRSHCKTLYKGLNLR